MLVVITAGKYHCIGEKRPLRTSKIMSKNQIEIQEDYQNILLIKKDCKILGFSINIYKFNHFNDSCWCIEKRGFLTRVFCKSQSILVRKVGQCN